MCKQESYRGYGLQCLHTTVPSCLEKKGKRDRSFLMRRALGSWHLCSSTWPIWGKTLWAIWSFATGPSKDAIKFSAAKWKQHNNIYSKSTSFGKEIWCGFILISLYYLREGVRNGQTAAGLLESQSGSCRRQGFRRLPRIILLGHIKEDAEVSVAVTVWLCYGDVVMWRSWMFGLLGEDITICCCYH